jgi:protein-S-isoprenylcysteine O-methyltransferase Ste14
LRPILNTLLFTVFVPGTVAGLIPWLLRAGKVAHPSRFDLVVGALAIVFGLAIYLHTAFWGFALHGRGTPAPIAPTKRLVIEGLHRYVRNPMYLGVLLIILGQAILFRSVANAVYAAAFWLIVHLFVLFYEEPTLSKQFGAEYDAYRAQVPRWFPRL